ncbi:effector-associated constant component EACC1 [Streptomyces sp. NPDC003016]
MDRRHGTEVRFGVAAGPDRDADLRSLYKWLSDDLSLRGHARIDKVAEDEDTAAQGRMGVDAEAVAALVSMAAAVAQLPISFDAWRRARRPRSPITVHVFGADPEQIAEILRAHGQEPPAAAGPEPPAAGSGSPDGTPPGPGPGPGACAP